jgi:hypothetical protein
MTLSRGHALGRRGLMPNYSYKVGFVTNLIVIKPIFNVFSPFLGVIG